MTHEYQCQKHHWPEPGSLAYRCPGCAVETVVATTPSKYKAAVSNRLSDTSGHAWDVIRKRIREHDNWHCRMCKRPIDDGEVDHIKPLENGGTNADDNLQYLCKPCHRRKTAIDRGYVQRTGWKGGNPTNPNHHWNKE